MLASSSETLFATSVFSPQVETNRRYFCLLSKNRKPASWTLGGEERSAPSIGFRIVFRSLCDVRGAPLFSDR
jgi:hypothetical protein